MGLEAGKLRAKPQYYREMAERSRRLASKINDAEIKVHLLDVEQQYMIWPQMLAMKAAAQSLRMALTLT